MQALGRMGTVPKIVAVLVALGIAAVGAAVLLRPAPSRPASPTARSSSEGSNVGGNWIRGTAGDPTKWSGAHGGEVVSIEDVKAKAGFRVPQPGYLPKGVAYAQTYWKRPQPNRPESESVELRYSTGLWIEVKQQKDPPDPWAEVDYLNSPEQVRSRMGDNPADWLKIKVNGTNAMAHESGTETVDGVTVRTIPAFVSWWKDGVNYEAYDLSGRPVSELLKVAESLK